MTIVTPTREGPMPEVQYVILVRHGSRDKPYDEPRSKHALEHAPYQPTHKSGYHLAERSTPGVPASLSLAGWLAEAMLLYHIKVREVWHSPHCHAKQTAEAYVKALEPQNLCCPGVALQQKCVLDPEVFWRDKENHTKVCDEMTRRSTENEEALLICGHQPQLTRIGQRLTGRKDPLPLRQSEAACVQLKPRRQLLWAISNADEETTENLRDKIKSKMDTSKLLVGLFSVVLGILLANIRTIVSTSPAPIVPYCGAFCILLSLALAFAAFFGYDRLLMPPVFWSGKPFDLPDRSPKWGIRRPPSPVHWVLYTNMVRIWKGLFIPSVFAFILGVLGLFLDQIRVVSWWGYVLVAVGAVGVLWWYCHFQPMLGSDD